jgi:hypothetical protein
MLVWAMVWAMLVWAMLVWAMVWALARALLSASVHLEVVVSGR